MIKKSIFFIILVFLLFFCDNSNINKNKKNYYRSGVVVIDSIRLKHNSIIYKSSFVQIILEKSSEEGIYIRTKTDSGLVYYKYIATLCWLKSNMKLCAIGTGNIYNLSTDYPLIFETVKQGKLMVSYKKNHFLIDEDEIYFDNKYFFYKILK